MSGRDDFEVTWMPHTNAIAHAHFDTKQEAFDYAHSLHSFGVVKGNVTVTQTFAQTMSTHVVNTWSILPGEQVQLLELV